MAQGPQGPVVLLGCLVAAEPLGQRANLDPLDSRGPLELVDQPGWLGVLVRRGWPDPRVLLEAVEVPDQLALQDNRDLLVVLAPADSPEPLGQLVLPDLLVRQDLLGHRVQAD